MTKMKKFLSLAMVAVLCTASVMPAFADEAVETPVVEAPAVEAPAAAPAETPAAPAEAPAAPAETPAEPAAEPIVIEAKASITPDSTTTTTTYTDEKTGNTYISTETTENDGTNTVTVKIDTWNNEDDPKATSSIEGEQTTVTTTTPTNETTVVDGKETETTVVEEKLEDETYPEVKVEVGLNEGDTNTEVAVNKQTVTDNIPGGSTENNSDITTTTEIERTVTTETVKEETVVIDYNKDGLVENQATDLKGLAPVYDKIDGVKEDKGGMFDYQFNSGATSKYANQSWEGAPDDAEVRYVGTGEHSKYYVYCVYVEYEKDADGKTVYDEEGKPVIKELRRYAEEDSPIITIDGEEVTELPEGLSLEPVYDNAGGSRPFMFMMMDKNDNKFYGYCCDLDTPTNDGNYYTMVNVEDSDYYASEESADHIRSIVMNGYWGTTDIPNDKGEYALGSLELLKQKMIAAIDAGEYPNTELTAPVLDPNNKYQPVTDEDGNIVYTTKTMKEMIEGLTSGEALLATQAAIWSFSNGHVGALNGKDGSIVIDPDGYKWNHDAMGNSKTAGGYTNGEAMDDFASTAVDFMYTWLINLKTEEESTTVINDRNFVENVSLTVKDKDSEHDNNKDEDKNNDVYNTDLNFKLAFIPGDKDDLLVQITYNDLDGNPVNVVRRLAGDPKEGETYGTIIPEEDGSYILSGLKLSEKEEFNFDLRLEGTQYLENGVYVYEACGGRENSQNFVGIASGDRNVDVTASMTIKFDVDESDKVVAERKWHKVSSKTKPGKNNPPEDPTDPSEDPSDPSEDPTIETEIREEKVPLGDTPELVEIPDEEVPLAAAPETGDNSLIYMLVSLISLTGALVLARKRREA